MNSGTAEAADEGTAAEDHNGTAIRDYCVRWEHMTNFVSVSQCPPGNICVKAGCIDDFHEFIVIIIDSAIIVGIGPRCGVGKKFVNYPAGTHIDRKGTGAGLGCGIIVCSGNFNGVLASGNIRADRYIRGSRVSCCEVSNGDGAGGECRGDIGNSDTCDGAIGVRRTDLMDSAGTFQCVERAVAIHNDWEVDRAATETGTVNFRTGGKKSATRPCGCRM